MKLHHELIRAPLRGWFRTGHGEVNERELLLVRLEAADGLRGYGEAAPLPSYDGVTLDEVRAALEGCREILADADRAPPPQVIARCAEVVLAPPALAALDLALWDLAGRRVGMPAWRLLSEMAAAPEPVRVNWTLTAADRSGAVQEAAQARTAGFDTLKVKVAIGDDHGRLAAIRAFAGPDMSIRIDANGAWTPLEARAALRALEPVGIELCEEPVAGLAEIRELAADTEIPLEELLTHLGSVGYTRTEMVEMPGQFAVRGGIIDVFSPESPRPVRVELLGDTVESVREFDPRTQRSIAPVVRTTLLPLTEWAVPSTDDLSAGDGAYGNGSPYFGPKTNPGPSALFELAESSLRPIIFLDEPATLREAAAKHLAAAVENYERHGQANAPTAEDYFWTEEQFSVALAKASQITLDQLALSIGSAPRFEIASRPSARFHGDVVACMGEVKTQLAAGGTVFLTAASTGELERLADICREYEVPYVLGESEDAAAGYTAEAAKESAALLLLRAPFSDGVVFPESKLTLFGNADLFEVAPSMGKNGNARYCCRTKGRVRNCCKRHCRDHTQRTHCSRSKSEHHICQSRILPDVPYERR